MPIGPKIAFTVALGVMIVAFLLLVDRGDRGAKDAWLWRGGQGDIARQAFMRPKGEFHKYAKPAIVIVWVAMVVLLWTLP